jgi:hypothetical protein
MKEPSLTLFLEFHSYTEPTLASVWMIPREIGEQDQDYDDLPNVEHARNVVSRVPQEDAMRIYKCLRGVLTDAGIKFIGHEVAD